MYSLLLSIHVVVSVLLVLVVLIQAGRSGGFSGFMGGGSDALFSTSSQQSGLRKTTLVMAGIFMATSLFITVLGSRQRTQSVIQRPFPNLPAVPQPQNTGQPTSNETSETNPAQPNSEVPKNK